MNKNTPYGRFIVLYIPWLLAVLLRSDAIMSYYTAWVGSFFILFITLTGWVRPLPDDRSIPDQLMRPIFLVQIIFAGYTCCTSIFYFLNILGYHNFSKVNSTFLIGPQQLQLAAQCQRYYCLGHAAFVTGILFFMNYPVKLRYKVNTKNYGNLLFQFAIISLLLSVIILRLPGLSQFSQFSSLSFIAGTLALAFAIPQKKLLNTIICIGIYISNFYGALSSGFKEPIIISVLVLGIFLYPTYKKIVTMTFIPVLFTLFFLLPTYSKIFRANAWTGNLTAEDATKLALDAALNPDEDIDDTNWGFFVFRLSEIDMFTKFVQSTPEKIDFYGTTLLKQSGVAVIPRLFWPNKPSTEELVMERVYDAGVINRASSVSAKPAFIVDAYLSFGGGGIFILMLLYGAVTQLISIKAESLFGGYLFGTALIFSGLFQFLWRGLSLEFIVNSIIWSYISMLLIAWFLRSKNILQAA